MEMSKPRINALVSESLEYEKAMRDEYGGTRADAEAEYDDPEYIAESVLPPPKKLERTGLTANEWLKDNDYQPIRKEILEKYGHA